MKLGQIFKPYDDVSWEVIEVLCEGHYIIRKLFDNSYTSDELYIG